METAEKNYMRKQKRSGGLWAKVKFGATIVGICTGSVFLQVMHDAYRDSKK